MWPQTPAGQRFLASRHRTGAFGSSDSLGPCDFNRRPLTLSAIRHLRRTPFSSIVRLWERLAKLRQVPRALLGDNAAAGSRQISEMVLMACLSQGAPVPGRVTSKLQLKLEFSSICGYLRKRSGAARSVGTAASDHQSREGDQWPTDNYDFLPSKFNRPLSNSNIQRFP